MDRDVIREIGGKPVSFRKLSYRDKLGLMRKDRARRRKDARAALVESAIDAEDIAREMAAFDATPDKDADWIRFVNSLDGQAEILAVALGEQADAVLSDPAFDLYVLELVCELTALKFGVVGEGDTESPPASTATPTTEEPPAIYGTTP